MNTSDSLGALRRANPRAGEDFPRSVAAAAAAARARILTVADLTAVRAPRAGESRPRRRLIGQSAAGMSLAAAAVAAALLTVGSPSGGPGVGDASAAVTRAATVTAASAELSGTAEVRITHGDEIWAGKTVRWHGDDLSLSREFPGRPGRAGSELLVVGGMMYGVDPQDGEWVVLGPPESIDPGSGTTPDEYLAATREDVGGVTLRRITGAMTAVETRHRADGTVVYSGSVAAGSIARETGFKESRALRLLPFGYVAHGEAADPANLLDAAVTVGADGIVRRIAVTWGTGASAWAYTVTYSGLGATPALEAPANARPLRDPLGRQAGS